LFLIVWISRSSLLMSFSIARANSSSPSAMTEIDGFYPELLTSSNFSLAE
jgi:hypothetical protein